MAKYLSDRAVQALREMKRRVDALPRVSGSDLPPAAYPPLAMYIVKTPVGGIAARSGTTPGSATCTLWTNANGALVEWDNTQGVAQTVTVYNLSALAVAASAYVVACQEMLGGTLLALWEDCP